MANDVRSKSFMIGGATLCAALFSAHLSSQVPVMRSVTGLVSSDSAGSHGIGEVDVVIQALNLVVRTNWMGEFRFPRVPPGTYIVEARRLGFMPVADTVRVLESADARVDFVLDQKPVTLESVVTKSTPTQRYISPNLRGFEARMNSHQGGAFVSDSVLRRNEDQKLPEVLQSRLSGMTFFRAPVGGATYAYSARLTAAQCGVFQACRGPGGQPLSYDPQVPKLCYVTIYLDGVRYGAEAKSISSSNPPTDLNLLNISDLAGVEFYPSSASVPMQFHNDNPCGTLLLWTRER